jgi:hypothetical protein
LRGRGERSDELTHAIHLSTLYNAIGSVRAYDRAGNRKDLAKDIIAPLTTASQARQRSTVPDRATASRSQRLIAHICVVGAGGICSRVVDSVMRPKKSSTPGRDLKTRGIHPANPLWPLAELGDLGKPRLIADPEFTSFDLTVLDRRNRWTPAKGPAPKAEFPIPRLVSGLPWRFAKDATTPVVPDPDFAPFQLGYIAAKIDSAATAL